MKLEGIKSKICEMIIDRFEMEDNGCFKNILLSLADKDLMNKEILRIRRNGIQVDCWKTLALVEIETDNESDIKSELRKAISWIAAIKESLLGTESTDLYLFLAFNDEVSIEECFRIESTEQFCRKYVLMPSEEIHKFVNRTFLQKLVNSANTIDAEDPLERAFSKTVTKYSWLTPETQKIWKKAFSDLSGSELADTLLDDKELV